MEQKRNLEITIIHKKKMQYLIDMRKLLLQDVNWVRNIHAIKFQKIFEFLTSNPYNNKFYYYYLCYNNIDDHFLDLCCSNSEMASVMKILWSEFLKQCYDHPYQNN